MWTKDGIDGQEETSGVRLSHVGSSANSSSRGVEKGTSLRKRVEGIAGRDGRDMILVRIIWSCQRGLEIFWPPVLRRRIASRGAAQVARPLCGSVD